MNGKALRSQLRTNIPGFESIVGTVTVASGVPSVGNGKGFSVGRGVLSLTVAGGPVIVGSGTATYANVPVTTSTGTTAVCSLTTVAGTITAAAVTAPGYNYTAANAMSVAVGSLFWTGGALAATTATAGTYYIPIVSSGGTGMVAKVVTSGAAITSVVVNPASDAATSVGTGYGTAVITYSIPAGALYSGSPAVTNAFTLTPNPDITVGSVTPVITGNFSVVYSGKVFSTVAGFATPIVKPGNTFFTAGWRYGDKTYANFTTLSTALASATPSDGDGFAFQLIATDSSVTA